MRLHVGEIIVVALSFGSLSHAAGFDQEIYEIQTCLTAKGYKPGPIDGLSGKNTLEEIKRFQIDTGFPVSTSLSTEQKKRLCDGIKIPIRRIEWRNGGFKQKKGLLYAKGESKPLTGVVLVKYDDGSISQELPFVNGERSGTETIYFRNGNKAEEVTWKDGIRIGKLVTWWENSQVRREVEVVDGKPLGKATYWKKNGEKLPYIHGSGLRIPAGELQGGSVALAGQFCFLIGIENEGALRIAKAVYVCKSVDPSNAPEILIRKEYQTSGIVRNSKVASDKDVVLITLENDVDIFRFDGNVWQKETEIPPPNKQDTYESFGRALAIDGDIAAIGAYALGKVFVYGYNQGDWTLDATITPRNPKGSDVKRFGKEVSVNGERIIVGAAAGGGIVNKSAVYIYEKQNSEWMQVARLEPKSEDYPRNFGAAVAISGDVAVVGSGGDCGSAYIFRQKQGEWIQEAMLRGDELCRNACFGNALAIEGDFLLVGDPGDSELGYDSGAVFVYVHEGDEWALYAKLKAPKPIPNARFGAGVALEGNVALVGAEPFVGIKPLTGESVQLGNYGPAFLFDLNHLK